jgi:hypothetical protein
MLKSGIPPEHMTGRSGTVSIDYKGRRLEGRYVVFGERMTVESGGHTKIAYLRGLAGAEGLARIMLRELADDGVI